MDSYCKSIKRTIDDHANSVPKPRGMRDQITVVNSFGAVIILSCVALRFTSRCFLIKAVGRDDYLILIALAFWVVTTSMFEYLNAVGQGKHIWEIGNPHSFFATWTVAAVAYSATFVFIKVSILFLYRRIFPMEAFRVQWWLVLSYTVGYSIASICCSIFGCTPISALWDADSPAHCINLPAFYIANGVLNCVGDLLILALPIPIIWDLALKRRHKIHLCMLFGMGILTCVVSIVRLKIIVYIMQHGNKDPSYDGAYINVWSQAEFIVAFACACAPALRPLLIWLFGSFFNEQSTMTDRSKRTNQGVPLGRLRPRASRDLELGATGKSQTLVTAKRSDWDSESTQQMVNSSSSRSEGGEERHSDDNGIVVHTSYKVQSRNSGPHL